jgi:hypothetical protein
MFSIAINVTKSFLTTVDSFIAGEIARRAVLLSRLLLVSIPAVFLEMPLLRRTICVR